MDNFSQCMHTYVCESLFITPKGAKKQPTQGKVGKEQLYAEQLIHVLCPAQRKYIDCGAYSIRRAERKTIRMEKSNLKVI